MSLEEEVAELNATVDYLKDREDILDCIQRESPPRDRQDVNQIAGCWWKAGVDEHGAIVTEAPEYPEKANAGHYTKFNMTSPRPAREAQRQMADRRSLACRTSRSRVARSKCPVRPAKAKDRMRRPCLA